MNIEAHITTKKEGNSYGSMGMKSKMNLMKSYKINKNEATQKRKKREENALDIVIKSLFKNIKATYLKGSDGVLLIKSDVIRL